MCTVPKACLDEVNSNYPARTKKAMLDAIEEALEKGIYPGWEQDIKNQSGEPIPIVKPNGEIGKTRKAIATSRLGRLFVTLFFDGIHDLDLHMQVCNSSHTAHTSIC